MALVVLFIEQPMLSAHVEAAASLIAPSPYAEALRLYYQAAVYLQRELGARDKPALPDLYSKRYRAPNRSLARASTRQTRRWTSWLNRMRGCHLSMPI